MFAMGKVGKVSKTSQMA